MLTKETISIKWLKQMLVGKHAQQHQEYSEECLKGMWMKHNKIKFSSWQVSIESKKRMNFSFETLRNYFIKIYIWIYNVFMDSFLFRLFLLLYLSIKKICHLIQRLRDFFVGKSHWDEILCILIFSMNSKIFFPTFFFWNLKSILNKLRQNLRHISCKFYDRYCD